MRSEIQFQSTFSLHIFIKLHIFQHFKYSNISYSLLPSESAQSRLSQASTNSIQFSWLISQSVKSSIINDEDFCAQRWSSISSQFIHSRRRRCCWWASLCLLPLLLCALNDLDCPIEDEMDCTQKKIILSWAALTADSNTIHTCVVLLARYAKRAAEREWRDFDM